jgi:hypothetical protein
MVMEYIAGRELFDLMCDEVIFENLTEIEIRSFIHQICSGLAYLAMYGLTSILYNYKSPCTKTSANRHSISFKKSYKIISKPYPFITFWLECVATTSFNV